MIIFDTCTRQYTKMAGFLKKFSDFLGLSDPEAMHKAPPLDGEIIYCKNNVCVHPPSNLRSNNVEHFPGYLTMRAQGNGNVQSSLLLTWIPNSSLNKSPSRRRSGVGSMSSSCSSPCFEKDRRPGSGRRFTEDLNDDSVSRDTAFSQECSTPAVGASVERGSPVGSLQSFQDSGIGEGDKSKASADGDVTTTSDVMGSDPDGHQQHKEPNDAKSDDTSDVTNHTCDSIESGTDAVSTDNGQVGAELSQRLHKIHVSVDHAAESTTKPNSDDTQSRIEQADIFDANSCSSSPIAGAPPGVRKTSLPSPIHSNSSPEKLSNNLSGSQSDLSKSSVSADDLSTEVQLAALITKDQGCVDSHTKKKTNSLERPSALHGLSSESDNNMESEGESSSSKRPGVGGSDTSQHHSHSSSSTTPTTSNPDVGSIPSTPSDEEDSSFDPLVHLYNQDTPSPDPVVSPMATYNMTFPENSVLYSSPVGGRKSPRPTVKEQLCGVFSVDLSEMRSLRLFFSNPSCTSGQLVIASQESQYKILHFHHEGLDRLAEVFEHWRYCIQQNSKKVRFLA